MQKASYTGIWILRLISAVVLSFLLLTGVALLHAAMNFGNTEKAPRERRITAAEVVRKQAEEKKEVKQRLRQVKATSQEGKSGQSQSAMRFSPDLSIDASGEGGAEVALQNRELDAEVFEQGQTDEDAVPEYTPEVPYPDRAMEQGIEGEVMVVFVVTHQGKTASIEVVKSPSPLLSAEVRRGVAAWKFKPAKNKGIPVNQRWRRSIEFRLDQ